MRQVSGSGEIGDVYCARTTTRIRRHANEENKRQDPKPRRQINLFMFMLGVDLLVPSSACVCVCVCVCMRAY